MLYLNDGVYGNFSSIIFDHQNPMAKVLKCGERFLPGAMRSGFDPRASTEYSIWGPTCDGIDCIAQNWTSREVIDTGDWLYFEDMGGE
jgi:ornithine decarboxylase